MLAENAGRTTSPESAVAVMRLQALTRRIVSFWSDVDVVVTPTLALPPVAVGWAWDGAGGDPQAAFSRQWQSTPFTAIVNVTGQPAMSVPLHWSDDGLPVGVQMIGAPFAEATLFRLAAQLEEARPWAHRRPELLARVWRDGARCRGAMGVAMQGREEPR